MTTLMRQVYAGGERLVHHLVYGVTKCRGKGVEVVEDLPVVSNTACRVATHQKPARVYLAPGGDQIPFSFENGVVTYTVPSFECGVMVAIEF